jgi:hypothetical protein
VQRHQAEFCPLTVRMAAWTLLQALQILHGLVSPARTSDGKALLRIAEVAHEAVKQLLDVIESTTEWLLAMQQFTLTDKREAWQPGFQAVNAEAQARECQSTAEMLHAVIVRAFAPR